MKKPKEHKTICYKACGVTPCNHMKMTPTEVWKRDEMNRKAYHPVKSGLRSGQVLECKGLGRTIKLRFVNDWGKASKFRILGQNDTQAIYIPASMITKDGLKDLEWFWAKRTNMHKLALAGYQ